jgi:transcriptional regulator with XRE-family HTH domain
MMDLFLSGGAPLPSTDEVAKAYELALAERFGLAVKARRLALKLSAAELSRRTAEIGYPITRGAIARIESNSRLGKIDVAELLALSAALDIPPVLLLLDHFPTVGATVEITPDFEASVSTALNWICGRISFPREEIQRIRTHPMRGDVLFSNRPEQENDGVKLILAASSLDRATTDRLGLRNELRRARDEGGDVDTAQAMLDLQEGRIEPLREAVNSSLKALWGDRFGQEAQVSEESND